jgi:hypothetical protein
MCVTEGNPPSRPSDSRSIRRTTAMCPLGTVIVLVKDKSSKAPIQGADVYLVGQGHKLTNAQGRARFSRVQPGKRTVRARKNAYLDDPAQATVKVKASSTATVTLKLIHLEVHMHVDANRDGKVDDDWRDNHQWQSGAGNKGAVILCNSDDEDSDRHRDSRNDRVDGAADLPDIAPLTLRKRPKGQTFPPGWKVRLEVSDRARIRIFDARTAVGTEVIGPNTGDAYEITDLRPKEHKLGMEATGYPTPTFNGIITLTLTLLDAANAQLHQEQARVRVAPWLLFNHAHPTKKVFVVATADNARFRTDLSAALTGVGLEVADEATYGADPWMQDVMELGFAAMPNSAKKAKWPVPTTLRSANQRDQPGGHTEHYPLRELLGPGHGWWSATTRPFNSPDSFGNLECTPPFQHRTTGRNYPFGRIIYGNGGPRRMARRVRDFLAAQRVQAPIVVDTDWLVVGHVDEVLSFLPLPDAPLQFKVVLASPAVALDIVDNRVPAVAPMFQGLSLPAVGDPVRTRFDTDYRWRTAGQARGDAVFRGWQTTVQAHIDAIRNRLIAEVGLQANELIHLPVLFRQHAGRYIAYTPGVANMLVVTQSGGKVKKLCIPKPFGPVHHHLCQFEEDIKTKLAAEGLRHPRDFVFIDDFTTYHMHDGEIHCGTNSLRMPPTDRWWWEVDWL